MPKQEIVVVGDRSGSMSGKEDDTVGGINASIDELKRTKGPDDEVRVSIKLFDHEELLHTRHKNLDEVEPFMRTDFIPRGGTALYDALGNTLVYFMEMKLRDPASFDSCVVYVATDGYENSSKHYSANKLKGVIENAEKTYNITVLYLGANQDAILEAGKFGISAGRAMNYSETSDTIEAAYRGAAACATRTRSSQPPDFLDAERQASTR